MEAVFSLSCVFYSCSQTFMPFEWSTGSTVFALNYTFFNAGHIVSHLCLYEGSDSSLISLQHLTNNGYDF